MLPCLLTLVSPVHIFGLGDFQTTPSKTSASCCQAAFVLVQFSCLHVNNATKSRLYQTILRYG